MLWICMGTRLGDSLTADQPGLYPSQAQAAFKGPRHPCPNVVSWL